MEQATHTATNIKDGLPVLAFASGEALRRWLQANHPTSDGIWVRIYKRGSRHESVTFDEVLDAGLCFGWSESKRVRGDGVSYLQRFAPRRVRGTTSRRNIERAKRLISDGLMTPAGMEALGAGGWDRTGRDAHSS